MPDTPPPDPLSLDPADVPTEGALGLLAFGYRGLEAWRAARGTGWIEERRREWAEYEAYLAAEAAEAAAQAPPAGANAPDSPPGA